MKPSCRSPVTFSLANSMSELHRLSASLEQIGEEWELSDKLVLQLNLVLDELFTNVICYGLDNTKQEVSFTLKCLDKEIEVIMCDEGKPFDPTKPADPDFDLPLEDKEIGGLGIFLARQYTDKISYRREAGKNILTLTKKI